MRGGEEQAFLAGVLHGLMGDEDKGFEAFLREQLPGVELAANTEIVFRLEMPGDVLETNAEERDGKALVWKFGPAEALAKPMELFARSAIDGS